MTDFSHLEGQVRECFGRVVYTHKTHEKMADNCATTLRRFKITQIWVSGLTASGAVIAVFFDPVGVKVVTALLSLLNRPGFPRHSPGSLRNAFQTLPVTADC